MAGLEQRSVRIESVAFNEQAVEVSFVQAHNDTDRFLLGEHLVVPLSEMPPQVVEEALDAIDELLDAMQTYVQNSPATKPPFRR
jgi:hypothetical protein